MLPARARQTTPSPCGSQTQRAHPRQHEPPAPTSRTPPFTTTQFHVLLNSLFKVLFNFPSRYLFTTHFELHSQATRLWGKSQRSEATALRAYHPLWAVAPVKVDLDWSPSCEKTLPNTTCRATVGPAVRCWALPVSFAITKGITVVFFSSAY